MRRGSLLLLALAACGKEGSAAGQSPVSSELSKLGHFEVTARLADIQGQFPPNKLYDYVYVMKYDVLRVHRGIIEGKEIFVGHYNPLKSRLKAEDKFSGKVGGNVDRFQIGDVHRMALEAPLDQAMPMVGLIDKYIQTKGLRYWAIWVDQGRE
jgi:hypothetical protein